MKLLFIHKSKSRLSDGEARRLTSAFLDGSTSLDDERRLYDYYRSGGAAEDLKAYAPMFGWYESLGADNTVKSSRDVTHRAAAFITAAIVTAAAVVIGLAHDTTASPEEIYAGSYIRRDGHTITDIDLILPELRRTEYIVDSTLLAQTVIPDCSQIERRILENAISGIDDPEIIELIKQDF